MKRGYLQRGGRDRFGMHCCASAEIARGAAGVLISPAGVTSTVISVEGAVLTGERLRKTPLLRGGARCRFDSLSGCQHRRRLHGAFLRQNDGDTIPTVPAMYLYGNAILLFGNVIVLPFAL